VLSELALYHDEGTPRFFVDWCDRHDLRLTGGSDYQSTRPAASV
jgi:hypothetical protein